MPGRENSTAQKAARLASNPRDGRTDNHDWLLALLLVVMTAVAYQPVWYAGFIWDDGDWTSNLFPHLGNFSGLLTIWAHPTVLQQYYPVTASTFWLDHLLWGFHPLPYHVENVLGHGLSAVLFWRWLRRLEVPGAWLAGAILAVHPLMVESVAWITERKNVVSLLFYLGALHAYGRFTRYWDAEPASAEGKSVSAPDWRAYGVAGVLFVIALLSKATAFSFPAVVLLICWWKRGRLRWRADVLPTLPFFAVSIGLGLFTSWLEKHHVGASGRDWTLTFPERWLIAGRVPWFYAGKVLWPAKLCFIYPRWHLNASSPGQWLYPVAAAGTLLAFWLGQKRIGRGPVAVAFIYAGTLFPVLGLMNAYYMRFTFVCDHLAYVSSLALIASAAALVERGGRKWRVPLALVVVVLGVLTWKQAHVYADQDKLWRDTLAKNPDCWMAHNNLGNVLLEQGSVDEAKAHFQKALEIKPDYEAAHYNLGIALLREGKVDEAIAHYQNALQINPDYAEAHNNLGNVLLQRGKVDEAIAHFQKALQIKPDYAEACLNLGDAQFQKGDMDEAIICFQEVLKMKPGGAAAESNLGNALLRKGKVDEAIVHFQKVVEIKPGWAAAYNNLGNALLRKGKADEAVVHFRKALQINPDYVETRNNLAWLLATSPDVSLRDGKQAVELALRANQLTGDANPIVLGTLAAAYAEAGRFPEAVTAAQHALQLAELQTNTALADSLRSQLKLYLAGQPYHSE